MAFIKGQSGNPKGRPNGSLNSSTAQLRSLVSTFLNNNFELIKRQMGYVKENHTFINRINDLLSIILL